MRIFTDCEFVERGPELPITLVSIAMVRDDGAELYLINADSLSKIMNHPFVSRFVRPSLPIKDNGSFIYEWDQMHPEYPHVVNWDAIPNLVQKFVFEAPGEAEIWGYYSAYDHVVRSQLYGSMAELPAGMPMITYDIQQMIKHLEDAGVTVELPPQPEVEHHALWDARWCRDAFNMIYYPERQLAGKHAAIEDIEDAEIVE